MSTGATAVTGTRPSFPHPGAWPSLYLGWAEKVRPVHDTTLTVTPLFGRRAGARTVVPGRVEPEHFLIESRATTGFDRTIPSPGLIVSQVDDAMIGHPARVQPREHGPTPGLRLLEGDGDFDLATSWNHGDANDPLPGAMGRTRLDDETSPNLRSLNNSITQVAIENIAEVPGGRPTCACARPAGVWTSRPWPIRVLPGHQRQPRPHRSRDGAGRRVLGRFGLARRRAAGAGCARAGSTAAGRRPRPSRRARNAAFEPAIALLAEQRPRARGPTCATASSRSGTARASAALDGRAPAHLSPDGCVSSRDRRRRARPRLRRLIQLRNPRLRLQCLAFGWASPFGTPATVSDDGLPERTPSLAATPTAAR